MGSGAQLALPALLRRRGARHVVRERHDLGGAGPLHDFGQLGGRLHVVGAAHRKHGLVLVEVAHRLLDGFERPRDSTGDVEQRPSVPVALGQELGSNR